MLSLPIVLRNGVITNLSTGDLINTREPEELNTNTANPTTITAAQLTTADIIFADPNTPENIVTLPTAEEIIQAIITPSNQAQCDLCADPSNTTVWASYVPEAGDEEEGSAARTLADSTFRRTFYRTELLGVPNSVYLELNRGLSWDFSLLNIGIDEETPSGDAVTFDDFEWKILLFRILNSSPEVSPVGAVLLGSNEITVSDLTFLADVTVGMKLYTGDDTVFVSSAGQLSVTAVNKITGVVTVSGNSILAADPLSFTLSPHINILPVLWGRIVQDFNPTYLETGITEASGRQRLAFAFNQLVALADNDEFVFHLPSCTILAVAVGLKTPSDTGGITFDITQNGVSILSTLITIDVNEDHSKDAAVPAVISDDTIVNWARMVLICTEPGANAFGPTVYFDVIFTGEAW